MTWAIGAILPGQVSAGDTAWMLVATALVLMMTPALGLFYAGLVRSKTTLNTFMSVGGAVLNRNRRTVVLRNPVQES